ncbi:hypothetical protein RHSIM_Rhsim05G0209700 [Rhododendron simsii]|uniref:Uncharacterized protein n=1 Tax=Rhododendron simsii TaxID=118357 RepID=A0A834H277_RHOSS|nr:hypothetical protein RHSIM_Rhsim05G0209700 [Rhododendron simsii]
MLLICTIDLALTCTWDTGSFYFPSLTDKRAGGGGLPKYLLSLFPSVSHYSSRPSFDESLLKVIELEIKCAEESDDQDEVRERVLLGDLMMWSSIANLKENLHKITLDVHNDDGDEGLDIYNLSDRKGHLHTDRRFPYCFAHSSPASHSPMANGFDSPYNDEVLFHCL